MTAATPPLIFSARRKTYAAQRCAAAQLHDNAPHYLIDDMVEDIIERLGFLRHRPQRALVLGDWTGALTTFLHDQGCNVINSEKHDDEQPLGDSEYDFIANICRLHSVNDLPGALIHIRNALAPGGLAIASFPGAGSLPALRHAMLAADGDRPAARLHPMVDVRAGGQLLQRTGLSDPVIDTRSLKVRFGSLLSLVHDLRDHGLGSTLANRAPSVSRQGLRAAQQAFSAAAEPDGKTTETFEILTLSGWRR